MNGRNSIKGFADDWDAYWRNARKTPSGIQDEALERFWLRTFNDVLPGLGENPAMLDVGTGNGLVIRFALAAAQNRIPPTKLRVVALDRSPAALDTLRKRSGEISSVVADAGRSPFRDGVFDLLTSQFGIEYANIDAVEEAARLLRGGGVLALVMHMRDGAIYRECAANLDAVGVVRENDLLGRLKRVFQVVASVPRNTEGQQLFRDADAHFGDAVAATEKMFGRMGKGIASGLLFRLYTDVGYMYQRLSAYDPKEVFNWIDLMAGELDSYAGRMTSMSNAALTSSQFDEIEERLLVRGFSIGLRDSLVVGDPPKPAAWLMIARRSQINKSGHV